MNTFPRGKSASFNVHAVSGDSHKSEMALNFRYTSFSPSSHQIVVLGLLHTERKTEEGRNRN